MSEEHDNYLDWAIEQANDYFAEQCPYCSGVFGCYCSPVDAEPVDAEEEAFEREMRMREPEP